MLVLVLQRYFPQSSHFQPSSPPPPLLRTRNRTPIPIPVSTRTRPLRLYVPLILHLMHLRIDNTAARALQVPCKGDEEDGA
jgi:hypothetical protein